MAGMAPVPLSTFKSMDTLLSREALCVGVAGINVPCLSKAIAAAPFVDVCAGNHRFRYVTKMLIGILQLDVVPSYTPKIQMSRYVQTTSTRTEVKVPVNLFPHDS
jgi:hypothetical protein